MWNVKCEGREVGKMEVKHHDDYSHIISRLETKDSVMERWLEDWGLTIELNLQIVVIDSSWFFHPCSHLGFKVYHCLADIFSDATCHHIHTLGAVLILRQHFYRITQSRIEFTPIGLEEEEEIINPETLSNCFKFNSIQIKRVRTFLLTLHLFFWCLVRSKSDIFYSLCYITENDKVVPFIHYNG